MKEIIFRGKLFKSHGERCPFCDHYMLVGQRAVIWQHRKDEVRMAHEGCFDDDALCRLIAEQSP